MLQVMAAAAPGEPPWEQPCKYELQVALERLVASEHLRGGDSAVSVMFLLDGSGSVTEGMVKARSCCIDGALCFARHVLQAWPQIVITCCVLQCR